MGTAASVGAGISMGFTEAAHDDGVLSGRGSPWKRGLASGMMLGLAIGFGGLGVAVNGLIADTVSLGAALATIPVPVAIAVVLMARLPYPWKSLKRPAGR